MDLSSSRIQTLFRAASQALDNFRKIPFWIRFSIVLLMMMFCWIVAIQTSLSHHEQLKILATEISSLTNRAEALEKQKELQKKMELQISEATRGYLKETVEKLPLLQGEKERVVALSKQFPDNPSLKERLHFLESEQNQIRFDSIRHGAEIEHRLERRVQMDLSDLKKFLEAVDTDRYDATQKKPFLLMKKFDLLKCYEKGDEKVYSIYAELIEK
jgi:hypothetical protein